MEWIKSTYDVKRFSLNKKREDSLLGLIEYFEDLDNESGKADAEDVRYILNALRDGYVAHAIRVYNYLDTAPRDEYPQWVAELAGHSINPAFFKKNETLEATE